MTIAGDITMDRQAFAEEDTVAPTDVSLLTRGLAVGDEHGFRAFHAQYFDRLTRFLLMVARGNEEEAKEALQLTLMHMIRHARRFETEADFWTWLKVVALNSARDLGRKQARYRRLLERFAARWKPQLEESPEEPSVGTALKEGLELMDSGDRALLENKYMNGLSIKELATEAGQTERAVEARLFRLRRELRERVLRIMRCP